MAAPPNPIIELLSQLAASSAPSASLQGQVTALQPGMQATAPMSFARTPAFMGRIDLRAFRRKADLIVYAEGKSPVFKGDEHVNVKTVTLGHFLKRLHKKVTDQSWNNLNNTQQIAMFDIMHNGAPIKTNTAKAYGLFNVAELSAQCRHFMTGADAQHCANQNNQMMQASSEGPAKPHLV